MVTNKSRVLILGGGFGGIKTAIELASDTHIEVSLLSDRDDFRYYPTLFRAATGGKLSASAVPIAEILKKKDVKFIKDSAKTLDRGKKLIIGGSGKHYEFDQLVIALGATTNYFGIKGLKEYAYGIKSVEEATRLRNHLHKQLLDFGKPDLNYVIVGGGPTGVELAGAMPGYLDHIMKCHGITKRSLHIDLVEAAPRLMSRMPVAYSKAVAKRLKKLGVKLYLNQAVNAETADALELGGHSIKSHTVVWTAGVANNPFFASNEFKLNEHGKVLVDEYLQAEDNIYVIGDNADTEFSGMAQTALYDAVFVSRNLKRLARGKMPKTYIPKKPVYVTPVGPHWAIVLWGKLIFKGPFGWLLRSFADFAGYNDYEPWWKSSKLWLAEIGSEEFCQKCSKQSKH